MLTSLMCLDLRLNYVFTSSALRVKSRASLQTISSDLGAGCDSNSI